MIERPHFLVIRHKKENLKKCSLRGLEGHPDIVFLNYPNCLDSFLDLEGYVVLDVEGEELSVQDTGPFLVLDATWRYAAIMKNQILGLESCQKRKIPQGWKTAYPRKQTECPNPEQGLATVEALFAAAYCTGLKTEGLLNHYYWREEFFRKNQSVLLQDIEQAQCLQ